MKVTSILVICACLAGSMAWSQEAAKPLTAPGAGPASPIRMSGLAPGDQLTVRMYDFPDVSSGISVHVSSDGTIHLPYAGTLQAEGESAAGLERAISEALQARGVVKQPNVSVDIAFAANLSVNVLGQVQSPRSIPLYAPVPLSYVMAQVGGLTGLAERRLTILHRGGDRLPTSVEYDPDAPNPAVLDTPIEPGDIVTVTSRGVYFVGGEVAHPGIYPIGGALSLGQVNAATGEGVVKNITLLEALAQAGGITAIAARSKLHILRTVDGKREDIEVDQVKLSKGEVADPYLLPNDIVYLPPSYWRQQTNNLFATALSSLYAVTSIKSANF